MFAAKGCKRHARPYIGFSVNNRKEVIQCLIVSAVTSPWSPAKSLI
jgi:hypothetical protein